MTDHNLIFRPTRPLTVSDCKFLKKASSLAILCGAPLLVFTLVQQLMTYEAALAASVNV